MGSSATTIRRWVKAAVTAGFLLAASGAAASEAERGTVVFFGDSLTAGYGLDEPSDAYPALLQKRIDAAGLPFAVMNAGLSGETTAGGARRINWVLRRPVSVFVLALGGNDGLRGVPLAETEKNLQTIIDIVWAKYPDARIVLTGMQALPNMGEDFTRQFREIFPRVAGRNRVPLVPFLLEGVGGVPEMNQGDGIHPNPRGARLVADNIWPVLEPVLRELTTAPVAPKS